MRGLLRSNKSFLALWLGQLASEFGNRMYLIALCWYFVGVLDSHGGLVAMLIAGSLPAVVIAPFIGPFIDRHDKRKIMIVSDLASAVIMLGMAGAIWFELDTWIVCACVFLLGTSWLFFSPSARALIPRIAGHERIQEATSLYASVFDASQFAGAAIGGILVGTIGIVPTIVINAVTYLVSAMSSVLISYREEACRGEAGFIRDWREGFDHITGRPSVILLLAMYSIANFIVASIFVYLPIAVEHYLRLDALSFGAAQSCIPVGMLMAAVIFSIFRASRHVPWVIAGFVLCGAALVTAGAGRTLPMLMASMAVMGFMISAANINAISYFTKRVDQGFHGRFFNTAEAIATVLFPVACLMAGVLQQRYDTFDIIAINGVVLVAVGVAGAVLIRFNPR
jgi:MFS family permease